MQDSTDKQANEHPRWMLPFLIFTALICGALIMVVEVLGSRVIGPFFGVSLFVWTSLIAVTLISLAMGYAVGGQLADRRGTADYLYGIIMVAGLAVLLIPLYKLPVLKFCVPMGLKLGAFVSATLLFGPSLFLLGCVSPLLVKIATREMKNLGKTVGGFYAVSTVGSVIGTALTGFVLIAYLGINSIFNLVGILLCLLGLVYFLFVRKAIWVAPVALVLFLAPTSRSGELPSFVDADGITVSLVDYMDSHYGSLKVVDFSYRDRHIREMLVDGTIQGGMDVVTGQAHIAYPYHLALLSEGLNPDIRNALIVGLGAGMVPVWLEQRGVRTDVVDIDPAVFDFAERYFNVEISGRKAVQDARYFLQTSSDRYDLIVYDVFSGDVTPSHLLSVEALGLAAQRLTGGGILAVNLLGNVHEETYMTASVVRTLEQVFDHVEIFQTEPASAEGVVNLALMAYQGERRELDLGHLRPDDISHYVREAVIRNIGHRFEFPESTPALVLTDDYNPIDVFDATAREQMRQRILEFSDWDILAFSD